MNHICHLPGRGRVASLVVMLGAWSVCATAWTDDRLVLEPTDNTGRGKHIVLVAGDEEYRSEETMPMLAKILSQRHGFKCTVLFSFGPDGAKYIDPYNQQGIRGLEALKSADLLLIGTRFRQPSATEAQHVTDFLDAGKPVIGIRTATHAFRGDGRFGDTLSFGQFGRHILGEEWVSHHGGHKRQGTRGVVEQAHADHPMMRGVHDVFAPSDVYGVVHLTEEDTILMRAAVTESLDPASKPISGAKNNPQQPLAWLHGYTSPDGKQKGRSFCTTAGASVDFLSEDLRRLIVNATYYLTGLEVPQQADVRLVDPFYPSFYGFIQDKDYWRSKNLRPADFGLGKSPSMPDPQGSPEWPFRPRPPATTGQQGTSFHLEQGQRIALVGNSLAERMNLFGYFETLLHTRFPEKNLVVRNFGWPADEVGLQQRPSNYTELDDPLEVFSPDLFICFFGFNESFNGADKNNIDRFVSLYRGTIDDKLKRFTKNGKIPRFVLVSPIAFEATGKHLQPLGQEENRRLRAYSSAIADLAAADGHRFVDLYEPTAKIFSAQPGAQFTINGVHLNEAGDRAVSQRLDAALFAMSPPSEIGAERFNRIRQVVNDKSWLHQQDYRILNGWYVYGGRRTWDTETFPAEYQKIRRMTSVRDQTIWDLANGRAVTDQPDDSSTGETFIPETMFGTRDDNFRRGREPKTLNYPTPEESMAQMTVPDGFQVEFFASEREFPELANPTQLNFDNQGRLWVSCMATYPQWQPGAVKPNDRLLILEDTNGDGRADRCQVFYDKLICPTGFEFWNGGVLVVDQPRILFLKDTDGDDRADLVVRLFDGLATDDTHHAMGAWEYSHGGLLHTLEGIAVSTTLETPWGPFRSKGPSGAYVIDPVTWKVRHFRTPGHGNPWCLVFDRWGNGIIGDGTGAAQHWASPLSGHAVSSRRTLRPVFDNENMRPAVGSDFLWSRHFPDDVQGQFVYGCVINMHGLPRFTIEDESDGAGLTGQRVEDLISSTDMFFRPVDPQIGPDGTLWFGDWCNALIGHMQYSQRDPHRDHEHGRIYRLVHKDRPLLKPVTQAGQPIPELLEQLTSYELRTRYRARRELRDRNREDVLAAVSQWIAAVSDPEQLCEAMWIQEGFRSVDQKLLKQILNCDDYRARAAAVHTIGNEHERIEGIEAYLIQAMRDDHPRVRLEAIRAASFLQSERAAEIALMAVDKKVDYWVEYTLEHTLHALEPAWAQSARSGTFLSDASTAAKQHFADYLIAVDPGRAVSGPLNIVMDPDSPQIAQTRALRKLVRSSGGAARRGEAVYQRVCATCHNIGKSGKAFGPDLSDIGKRYSKEEIIKSIVWPSEEITKGYETVVVVTGDGKSISGFVIEEDENTLVLGVAEGKVQRFDKSDLEERKDMKASSMPEGLTKTIAPIEFLDLVEYLQVQKTPVEKASPSNQDDAHRVSP